MCSKNIFKDQSEQKLNQIQDIKKQHLRGKHFTTLYGEGVLC